jgi:hypothetical protein
MLTVLLEKLAEAHGLAISSSTVAAKLRDRIADPVVLEQLELMRTEADQTRQRCLVVESTFGEELGREMLAHANSTSETGADLVGAWFKAGTDPLRAWLFLIMGEAAEVAAWSVVRELAEGTAEADVKQLAEWALPVQERHLALAYDCLRQLTRHAVPHGPRWG